MKTLYINISGKDIQSSDYFVVVGRPENALINKFHFEFGNEIKRGVYAPDVKQAALITGFMSFYKSIYEEKILPQLEKAKSLMLSQDLRGNYSIQLPQEYIEWLNYNGESVYSEIAKSLKEKGNVIEINLARIYRNGIMLLVNNIEPGNYGQLVVNDNAVEDDTEMIVAIRNKVNNPMLPFIPFEEYEKKDDNVCPKCEKNPCECVREDEKENLACPKCGKNPCECKDEKDNFLIFAEDSHKVSIYRPSSSHPIYEGEHSKISIERWDGHDYLELKHKHGSGGKEKYTEVSIYGISKDLDYNQTIAYKKYCFENNLDFKSVNTVDIAKKIKEKSQQYESVTYIGYSVHKNVHVLIGYFHENEVNHNPNGGEVITETGEVLFRIKDEIVPQSVFPSGLLLCEKLNLSFQTGYYGVMDISGQVKIPCTYLEHPIGSPINSYLMPKEIEPCIIKFEDFFINANTGERYLEVLKHFYVLSHDKDKTDVDIIDKKTGNPILCNIAIKSIKDKIGEDEWCLLETKQLLPDRELWEPDRPMLIHPNGIVQLSKSEELVSYSENRIITYLFKNDNTSRSIDSIIIRNYKGELIKKIPKPDFRLVNPYSFGNALGSKGICDEELIYLDMDGNEHIIPRPSGFISKYFFASKDTIVVHFDVTYFDHCYFHACLINKDGEILLDKSSDYYVTLSPLPRKYLKLQYWEDAGSKYDLLNEKGENILFRKSNIGILQ